MYLTLEAIQLMAYRGNPLHLTTAQDRNDPTAHTLVRTSDGASCKMKSEPNDTPFQRLASALRHYPGPATINGITVDTSPFPDQANIFMETYKGPNARYNNVKIVDTDPARTGQPARAHIAGIICNIDVAPPFEPYFEYYTPGAQGNSHWRFADKVTLYPVWVITTQELDEIESDLNTSPILYNSALKDRAVERNRLQVQRTLNNPHIPPRHNAPVFRYFMGPDNDVVFPFDQPAPIIVRGTPVVLDEGLDRPTAISAAEAMYHSGEMYVPVSRTHIGPHDPTPLEASHFYFNVSTGTPGPTGPMRPATGITMTFKVEAFEDCPEQTVQVTAPLFMYWDHESSLSAWYAPEPVSRDYLADTFVRANWTHHEYASWDHLKEALRERELEARDAVRAALDGPGPVYTEQLSRFAGTFRTRVPAPDRPVTVTSADGAITVTYNPPKHRTPKKSST